MIFNFQSPQFHYEPYPIGVIKSVFSPEHYDRMVREWPPFDKFAYMENLGKKYSLSELNNAPAYHNGVTINIGRQAPQIQGASQEASQKWRAYRPMTVKIRPMAEYSGHLRPF